MAQTSAVAAATPRKVGNAYILYFFLGLLGAHQFYMGKVARGLSMLFTLGWLGIGMLVDLFTLESQVIAANRKAGITMQYVHS